MYNRKNNKLASCPLVDPKDDGIRPAGKPDECFYCNRKYYGTAIQTEHIIRDLSPITTDIYGYLHGRKARPGNPCYVWMTEIGFDPSQLSISDSRTALALKAKTTARTFCFYLHKGCKKVTLHATSGGDTGLGIVQDNFLTYCNGNTVYPA